MKNNINIIVKKLESFLRSDYGKCEALDGTWKSGDEQYHMFKITTPDKECAIIIARDIPAGLYMAQFTCNEEVLDIYFGWNTRDNCTIRWRYYFSDGKYTQGYLDEWFLCEETSKTMYTLIGGTGIGEDGHEGHYFHTITNVE